MIAPRRSNGWQPQLRNREVLMVTNAVVPDQLGGLQRYVRELSEAIAKHGVEVTILTKRTSPDLAPKESVGDGVSIQRFATPAREHPLYAALYPAASVGAVARVARRFQGTIHVHFPAQAAGVALTTGRYVHTFHAPIHKELLAEHQGRYALSDALRRPMVSVARAGESLVARRSSETIVLTRYMQRELAQLSQASAERATVIPGGIEADRFSPGAGIATAFALDARPLLFTARRLVPRTGVAELVRAMPRVLARIPDARLAVAGDGPLRAAITELVQELGLRGSVEMLGRVSDDDLISWYRAATLFVLPTQELEGFGTATIEALSCGTPTLGTPVGGTPEILAPIDRRLLARSACADDLADGIIELLETPDLLATLSRQVRKRVVPDMTWSAVAERHLEVYERARLHAV